VVGRDVARSLADGSIHTLTVPLGPSEIQIDGRTIPIDRQGISGRLAVDGRGRAYATVIGWHGGSVLVRDDGRLVPMTTGGRFWTAIRPLASGVEVYTQGEVIDGENARYRVYDENGTELRSFIDKYGSMGILQVTGPNSIKSSVQHITTIAGTRLFYAMTVDGWTVGQLEYVPPGGAEQWGTLGLVSPDGQLFYANLAPPWNGYTNMPSHLAVSGDGVPFVAINDPTPEWLAPEPSALTWSPVNGQGTLADAIARNRPAVSAGAGADNETLVLVAGLAALAFFAWRNT
jgi:hypothetical protein